MQIKLMYKIHGLRTANGVCRSAGNDKFYETEDEAVEAARGYVAQDNCDDSMVVYKAHVLIRRSHPPIEVLSISLDGNCEPLR